MTATTAPRTNTYAAKCTLCGQVVLGGEGILTGSRGAWKTTHSGACPAPVARPAALTAEDVGIYVNSDAVAIKVVKAQTSGRYYTKRLTFSTVNGRTSMDWEYAPNLSIAGLPKMADTQAAEIGLSCQQCVNCLAALGGVTISAKVSAVIGYGATCAANNGWFFPQGVKAQRAFLAERGVTA